MDRSEIAVPCSARVGVRCGQRHQHQQQQGVWIVLWGSGLPIFGFDKLPDGVKDWLAVADAFPVEDADVTAPWIGQCFRRASLQRPVLRGPCRSHSVAAQKGASDFARLRWTPMSFCGSAACL